MANIGLNAGFVNAGGNQLRGTSKASQNKNNVASDTKHYGSRAEFEKAREAGKISVGDTYVDNGRLWEVGVVIDGGRGGYSAGSSKFA